MPAQRETGKREKGSMGSDDKGSEMVWLGERPKHTRTKERTHLEGDGERRTSLLRMSGRGPVDREREARTGRERRQQEEG